MNKKKLIIQEIITESTLIQNKFWEGYFEDLGKDRTIKPQARLKRIRGLIQM